MQRYALHERISRVICIREASQVSHVSMMISAVVSNSTTVQPGLGLLFPVSFSPGEVVQSTFPIGNSAAGMCQWNGKILTFWNPPLKSGVVIPYMMNCFHLNIQFVEG
jgi:hypothetical protein